MEVCCQKHSRRQHYQREKNLLPLPLSHFVHWCWQNTSVRDPLHSNVSSERNILMGRGEILSHAQIYLQLLQPTGRCWRQLLHALVPHLLKHFRSPQCETGLTGNFGLCGTLTLSGFDERSEIQVSLGNYQEKSVQDFVFFFVIGNEVCCLNCNVCSSLFSFPALLADLWERARLCLQYGPKSPLLFCCMFHQPSSSCLHKNKSPSVFSVHFPRESTFGSVA